MEVTKPPKILPNMPIEEKFRLLHDYWDTQRPDVERQFETGQREKMHIVRKAIKSKLNEIVGYCHAANDAS